MPHDNVVVLAQYASSDSLEDQPNLSLDPLTGAPDRLLMPTEVAAMLGVKEHTLAVWRSTHRVPLPYVKVGRKVRYRLSDVLQFIGKRASESADRFLASFADGRH
jgi:predicted DNA-binding transcriptional regulator AlpA